MNDDSISASEAAPSIDDDVVIAAAADGELLATVLFVASGPKAHTGMKERTEPFVRLHREGRIDLLEGFSTRSVSRLESGVERLAVARFYEAVLPEINADLRRVMDATARLLGSGDGIGMSSVLGAFRSWCGRQPRRSDKVLDEIDLDAGSFSPLVRPALQAGFDSDVERFVGRALDLAGGSDPEVAWQALGALETLNLTDHQDLEAACVDTAARLVARVPPLPAAERVGAQALQVLVEHCLRTPDRLTDTLSEVLDGRPTSPCPQEQRVLARLLDVHGNAAPSSIIDAALVRLTRLDRTDGAVVAHLDSALSDHHERLGHARLSNALRTIASGPESTVGLDDLGQLEGVLRGPRRDLLGHLLIDWLWQGNLRLCQKLALWCSEIGDRRSDVPFDLSDVPSERIEIICRRGAVTLLFAPVAATDLFVAALHATPDSARARRIGDLMFNTVGLNYPVIVLERLGASSGGTRTSKRVVRQVIERLEHYRGGLDAASVAVELRPSESDRRTAHRQRARASQKLFAEARKNSILSLIATTSTILHGTSVVRYGIGEDDASPSPRHETAMRSTSVSMDRPRLDFVDPVARLRALHAFDHLPEREGK